MDIRSYIVGDLNGWIGDRTRAVITSGVPGENDNGRRLVEFCEEKGLCVSNTYFKHDRSCAGEEGYATICANCEGGERDGSRPLRPLCCTV